MPTDTGHDLLLSLTTRATQLPLAPPDVLNSSKNQKLTTTERRQLQELYALGDLRTLAPLLSLAFGKLNHMQISTGTIKPEDDGDPPPPFSVRTTNQGDKIFPRRVFTSPNLPKEGKVAKFIDSSPATLPEFGLEVIIGKDFNIVTDLPALVARVESAHNAKMREYGVTEPMAFLNASAEQCRYWDTISTFLKNYASNHQDLLTLIDTRIIDTLHSFANLSALLAQGFRVASKDNPPPLATPVDDSAVMDYLTTKLGGSLDNLLNKLNQSKRLDKDQDPDKVNRYLTLALKLTSLRAQDNLLSTLNTKARDVFFAHAQAELYRKAGLGTLMERQAWDPDSDDPSSVIKKDPDTSRSFIDYIHRQFPKNQTELDELKTKLTQAKESGAKEELTELELKLAHKLCALVYSEKFLVFKTGRYSFAEAIEQNEVNCMARAAVLDKLWEEYTGLSGFGIIEPAHYYFAARLADGTTWSLDSYPKLLDTTDPTLNLGPHQEMYQLGVFNWLGTYYKDISGKEVLAEALYREAIRLNPEFTSAYHNLAILLQKDPERVAEAEELYQQANELNPNDPWYPASLANFYQNYATHIPNKQVRFKQALAFYQKSLELMSQYPDAKNRLTQEQIKERIKSLKSQLNSL